jgi:hypothetical protein
VKPIFRFVLAAALTLLPAAARAQTAFGNAISFNGTNQYVNVPNFGNIIPTGEITVEFWAYTSNTAQQSAFMLNPDSNGNRLNAHLNYGSPPGAGSTYWDFGNISGAGRLGPVNAPANSVGNWVHYAFVASLSGNYMSIYTNGSLMATQSGMTPFTRGTYALCIGGDPNSFCYHGVLDEFRVWSTALSQAQIQSNLGITLTGNEPNLLVYYRFDGASGTVATNYATATGSAYNGTLMGGATWVASTVATASALNSVVTSSGDSGAGSLRAAIANGFPGTTISFAAGLPLPITLSSGPLMLNKSLTIDASALASGFTINGNGANRIFQVAAGSTVTLKSLTLTNGLASGANGGAIDNSGTLTLAGCTVAGNLASTTITGIGNGGGIANETGAVLNLNQCTVAENSAAGSGGGIENLAALTINECTIASNSCSASGGGIDQSGSSLVMADTILAGNTATSSPALNMAGAGLSASYCLIDNGSGSTIVNGVSGNLAGGPGAPLNAMLGPLTNNGGSTATMALLPGSPGIDAGGPFSEVQQVAVTGSAGSTFTLTFNGATTTSLAAAATAAQVSSALNSLAPIGGAGGSVSVSLAGGVYTIIFGGALAGANQPQLTAAATTGLTVVVSTLADGAGLPSSDQRGPGFPRVFNNVVDIGAYELSPDISATGVLVTGTEGSPDVGVEVATFSDRLGNGPAGNYSAVINWGDGATTPGTIGTTANGLAVLGNHTYAAEGLFIVSVTITNNTRPTPAVTASSTATISDPPVVPTGGFTVTGSADALLAAQTVATFTDPGGVESLANYIALINWGDSSPSSPGTISLNAGTGIFSVQGSHTYSALGHFTISINVLHGMTTSPTAFSSAAINTYAPGILVQGAPNPSVFGQSVTCLASVTPPHGIPLLPTGSVQFAVDGASVGPPVNLNNVGNATFTPSGLSAGQHTVTATYFGDANFAPGTGNTANLVVGQANTVTAVMPSSDPSQPGQTVSFTATINVAAPGAGTPTGTVQFSIDGTNAGSPAPLVFGSATFTTANLTVTGSPHIITASYSGDSDFNPSGATLPGGQTVLCIPIVIVQNPNDSGPGSLRAAVDAVCPGGTITFFPAVLSGATIILTSGELPVGKSMTIDASDLPLGLTISGNNASRVFEIAGGAVVTLNSLNIEQGMDTTGNGGGGILNNSGAVLTVNNCTFFGNTTASFGGAIRNVPGAMLSVNQSTFALNSVLGGFGGAIASRGTATIAQSTFSQNSAGNQAGGIFTAGGLLTLVNCIVAGNSASSNPDVLGVLPSGSPNLIGGDPMLAPLANYGGPTLTMPPLAGSPAIDAGSDTAAGTFPYDQRGPGFTRVFGLHADLGAVESDFAPAAPLAATQPVTAADLTDANLNATVTPDGAVTDYYFQYGPTTSYGFTTIPGSLGAGATGVNAVVGGLTPGTVYHFRVVAINDLGLAVGGDMAFHTGGITTLVSNVNDGGPGSLRAAIAASSATGDNILFASNLSGATITLTNDELLLINSLAIDASALAGGLTINGNGVSRVFEIGGGATNVLTGLTVTNGSDNTGNGGGGILVNGTLILNQCTVAGSTAAIGGGILNEGTLVINRSTLGGNAATNSNGGGVENVGTLVMNECTVAGNTATNLGGGIHVESGASGYLSYCTISADTATNSGGGGISVDNLGSVTLSGCIVAGDFAPAGDIAGAPADIINDGFNRIGGNPRLSELGYYGGPTQTMPPTPGSPVINGGSDSITNLFTTDQRGLPRLSGAHVDIGAAEYQVAPPVLSGLSFSGGRTFGFGFSYLGGTGFTVFGTTNVGLPLNLWSNLGSAVEFPAGSGHFQFTDPQAATYPNRYYRVRSP